MSEQGSVLRDELRKLQNILQQVRGEVFVHVTLSFLSPFPSLSLS
jgi:hypothetical protein